MILKKGDKQWIASQLKCDRRYINMVLSGERSQNTTLAKKILRAVEIVSRVNTQMLKEIAA